MILGRLFYVRFYRALKPYGFVSDRISDFNTHTKKPESKNVFEKIEKPSDKKKN